MPTTRITVNEFVKHPAGYRPAFVYLASQSPRRSQLLTQLGVAHELLLPDADEDAEALEAQLPREKPNDYVQRVTDLKLTAALQRLQRRGLPPAPVLCADTTVALGRHIYGKPVDERDAARMLGMLAGRTHRVITSVSIAHEGRRQQRTCVSRVTFSPLAQSRIAAYIATGEPMGKAGAYAIQGQAAAFRPRITGSYSGIMGLPLFDTAILLASLD